MADNEPEGQEAPLERHLFAAGGDTNTAEKKLLGLLSEADLDANRMVAAGPEEGDSPVDDKAPVVDEGEQEEEGAEEGDPLVGEEEAGEDDGEADGDEIEYEYVDAEGNVIEEEGTESETYTVLVDGKEHEVSLEDLTQSYSFRAHNTRKSQELAKARTELETESATGRESREVYAQRLKQVEQALGSIYPQEPDWDTLEREDPTRFATESAKWTRHQRKVDGLRAEQLRVQADHDQDQLVQFNAYRAGEAKQLMEAIPEWAKDDVQAAEQKRLYAYALNTVGFSEEEIDTIVDHRAVVALRKAMLFDELQARGRKVRKKGQKTTPLKPGIRRRRVKAGAKRSTVAARKRLSETGSVKAATDLLYDMLPEDA